MRTRRDAEAAEARLVQRRGPKRRDASPWTTVQGVLAPVQFLVCLVSVALILRYLLTGEGYALATVSIVVKTLTLYTIMVTGAIWEKEVFGVYLFAEPFFWEDVVSFGVIALHTFYLFALFTDLLGSRGEMAIALAAYVAYVVNAVQFVLKLRAARLQEARERSSRETAVDAAAYGEAAR